MSRTAEMGVTESRSPPFARLRRPSDRDRSRKVTPAPTHDLTADLAETTAGIIAECGNPARVLEFYYWSRQPGLADLIRAFQALPAAPRKALAALLTKTSDPRLLSVRAQRNGQLTLFPPRAPKAQKR